MDEADLREYINKYVPRILEFETNLMDLSTRVFEYVSRSLPRTELGTQTHRAMGEGLMETLGMRNHTLAEFAEWPVSTGFYSETLTLLWKHTQSTYTLTQDDGWQASVTRPKFHTTPLSNGEIGMIEELLLLNLQHVLRYTSIIRNIRAVHATDSRNGDDDDGLSKRRKSRQTRVSARGMTLGIDDGRQGEMDAGFGRLIQRNLHANAEMIARFKTQLQDSDQKVLGIDIHERMLSVIGKGMRRVYGVISHRTEKHTPPVSAPLVVPAKVTHCASESSALAVRAGSKPTLKSSRSLPDVPSDSGTPHRRPRADSVTRLEQQMNLARERLGRRLGKHKGAQKRMTANESPRTPRAAGDLDDPLVTVEVG